MTSLKWIQIEWRVIYYAVRYTDKFILHTRSHLLYCIIACWIHFTAVSTIIEKGMRFWYLAHIMRIVNVGNMHFLSARFVHNVFCFFFYFFLLLSFFQLKWQRKSWNIDFWFRYVEQTVELLRQDTNRIAEASFNTNSRVA